MCHRIRQSLTHQRLLHLHRLLPGDFRCKFLVLCQTDSLRKRCIIPDTLITVSVLLLKGPRLQIPPDDLLPVGTERSHNTCPFALHLVLHRTVYGHIRLSPGVELKAILLVINAKTNPAHIVRIVLNHELAPSVLAPPLVIRLLRALEHLVNILLPPHHNFDTACTECGWLLSGNIEDLFSDDIRKSYCLRIDTLLIHLQTALTCEFRMRHRIPLFDAGLIGGHDFLVCRQCIHILKDHSRIRLCLG